VDDPTSEHPIFVTYTTSQGLLSNYTANVAEDFDGNIYVATIRGIDKLNPQSGRIERYTSGELPWTRPTVTYRDRHGALWFGSVLGLYRFTPRPAQPRPPPPILIGGLRVRGVPQPVSELGETEISELELGPNENQIQIDFFGLDFWMGEALRYQFKLEGADSDWSALTDQRSVNYASLSPGTYRFLVRAVGAGETISATPAVVTFRILPPIWQRWWFITLAVLLVGLAAYAGYRYRVGRLLELERVRTRIATDLHDDIGSSLSQISVLSEVINKRVGQEPSVAEPLTMIGNLSRDLVDSLNDIVWAINPRRDRLSDLTYRMRRFASDAFTARDIQFRFNAPDPHHNVRLGADTRREVFLIFKEAINNMVRHSQCTEADIDFVMRDGRMELSLTDNGRGFNPERESDGNGLVNMRQRAGKVGGTLDISSGRGRGTTVSLKVPLK
jgi:hypothetical protein